MTTTPIEPVTQAEITLHDLKVKFASFAIMANKVAGDDIAYTVAEWIEQIAEHEPSRTTPAPSQHSELADRLDEMVQQIEAEYEVTDRAMKYILREAAGALRQPPSDAMLLKAIAAFVNKHQGSTIAGIDELDELQNITYRAGLFDDQVAALTQGKPEHV